MFAVIYQGYIKKDRELEYQQAWNRVAKYFVEKRGAIGSCLHRTPDGLWVAYSRWPDKETRDASWPSGSEAIDHPQEICNAIATIKDCVDADRKIPEICMEVVDDLLLRDLQELRSHRIPEPNRQVDEDCCAQRDL